ncbi:MAG TPA: uridine kinase [Verrucomicrobiae bacterium]|nr:uridine kinase [Verrucomicrobiae bacterium]
MKIAPLLVAITGGSGSGKTWLAERLETALAPHAQRISLDDFYHDRSHLTEARRGKINFDHPRAIDWAALEAVLTNLMANCPAALPCYDFKTHCREQRTRTVEAARVVLVDGLWLLRPVALRRMFDLKVFIECPIQTRLRRRIERDIVSRGRTRSSVEEQFRTSVEPMHQKFVAPQRRWADVVLPHDFSGRDVTELADRLQRILKL